MSWCCLENDLCRPARLLWLWWRAVRGGWLGVGVLGAAGEFPAGPDVVAGVPVGVVLQVVLVLGFGLPERPGRGDLGDYRAGPQPGGVDVGDGVLGDALLGVGEVEDRGPVAGAD